MWDMYQASLRTVQPRLWTYVLLHGKWQLPIERYSRPEVLPNPFHSVFRNGSAAEDPSEHVQTVGPLSRPSRRQRIW